MSPSHRKASPAQTTQAGDAWAIALRAADGDARRLEVQRDGVVHVHNSPEWREQRKRASK